MEDKDEDEGFRFRILWGFCVWFRLELDQIYTRHFVGGRIQYFFKSLILYKTSSIYLTWSRSILCLRHVHKGLVFTIDYVFD